MTILYIAGRDSGDGATAVSAALALCLLRKGKSVELVKLVTPRKPEESTARLFSQITGKPQSSSVEVDCDGVSIKNSDSVKNKFFDLNSNSDVVVVDGFSVNDSEIEGLIELPEKLMASVIGIQRYIREDAPEWHTLFGESLKGLIVNRYPRYARYDAEYRLAPALQFGEAKLLGLLSEERALLAPSLIEVAQHLGAKFYVPAYDQSALIEHFLIGGLVLEWGVNYFSRFKDQGVIVRGNRPDIAMAALNCDPACVILTGGFEPAQYVYNKAQEEEVPLLTVEMDTLSTADALESIQNRVNVHNFNKVEKFTNTLRKCLDWNILESVIARS